MAFDPRAIEAQIALDLIGSTDMPKLAWDALEAGLNGPAIRRLAALEFPTFFEVRELLPHFMEELRLVKMSRQEAAVRLAKIRAREILRSGSDPLQQLRDFEQLWIQADYCTELSDYGNLADEVNVAHSMGQPKAEIRTRILKLMQVLAAD